MADDRDVKPYTKQKQAKHKQNNLHIFLYMPPAMRLKSGTSENLLLLCVTITI